MSVERAIVIKYSIYAKSRYTIRSAWLIVVLIWFISVASSLPPLFGKFNRFTLDPSKTSCTRKCRISSLDTASNLVGVNCALTTDLRP